MPFIMKIIKLFLLAFCLVGFSHMSVAQTSIDAEASITLGADVRVEKISDLHFGDIMGQPVGGAVRVNPSDGSVVNVSGNFQLIGNSTAAIFQVSGTSGQSFLIASGSYPAQITLRNEQGNTMIVNNFQIIPSSGNLDNTGTALIKLGGTLNIGASQPAGNYTNTTDLTVTISFQ
jgi:hypothetical protein